MIYILIILFLIYTAIVCFWPEVTILDNALISEIQERLGNFSLSIPLMFDFKIYILSIILPIITGLIYFIRKYLIIDAIILTSVPITAYILNTLIKITIQRARPPLELQLAINPSSSSYVSRHTFIIASLWIIVIYYVFKYCKNKFIKFVALIFGMFLIFAEGFSRIWLGVHNPTDVLGSYILASILAFSYIRLIKLIGGKI